MKVIVRTQFGNPILRRTARRLNRSEINSTKVQNLIKNMRTTLIKDKLGVGLAAPQVGKSIALAVIVIRPTPHRPRVNEFDLVLINPVIIKHSNSEMDLWEGCISAGSQGKADLFAKVKRYKQVTVSYLDKEGIKRTKNYSGLQAQVIQHEVDHLNGVLFVDHVTDPKTYMTYNEYMKRVRHVSSSLLR